MTSHLYRAVWPILDDSRPRSALVTEASAGLDTMARLDGARLTGTPTWTVAGNRLVCEVPAVPLTDEQVDTSDLADRDAVVLRLASLNWSLRQIAATTGVPHSTVRDIVARHARTSTPERTRAA
ncbi:hypothetical protein EYA84_02190 [Verrucosispora sp. SN26_14.1]|uniref:helix-turn-helix domain-containing protein n=1 Tax=Verrucosispora sp. SN26_14.1 TaxID=2527879 RepID=UPI0010331E18|nr:helix-turn-helix domain-containing protein [Verrucosispora sp. SN26_14.1]TBL44274.1 hypothetical protein EYA84_02190 [Verrucosispora sp. SN26_14.1]